MRVLLFISVLLSITATATQDAAVFEERPRCAAVGVPGEIETESGTLIEIPDVTNEAMRRVNLQLSNGCLAEVRYALQTHLTANPDDPQGLYVLARYIWIAAGRDAGEEIIDEIIAANPYFLSARLLLAGVRIEQERYEEATAILDDLGPDTGDRLWVYMNRLRIRASTQPDDEVRNELLRVLENEQFPPNARDEAAHALRRSRFVGPDMLEASYRIPLTYHSGSRFGCKLHGYALLMTERLGRFADAVEALEPYVGRDDGCPNMLGATNLLGYAYLALAAELAPLPRSENQAYVDRANELLADGGHARLASFLVNRPRAARLEPFLQLHVDPDSTDEHGRTRLCNAVMQLNPATVRRELERGAAPNGTCGGESLVMYVAVLRPPQKRAEQEDILRLLLAHGGRIEKMTWCNPAVVEGCTFYLYPIFEEYGY